MSRQLKVMAKEGTPPRMRGRHLLADRLGQQRRNTPADAGTTVWPRPGPGDDPEHPRGCGDDALLAVGAAVSYGTPPRMRGRPHPQHRRPVALRNTPADAGTTSPSRCSSWPRPEHPRGCGDDVKLAFVHSSNPGTPPRMRGRPWLRRWPSRSARNTPADAGTTLAAGSAHCRSPEHPVGGHEKLNVDGHEAERWRT